MRGSTVMTMRIATVIAVFLSAFLCQAQECNNEGICDEHARCPVWKEEGECFKNKAYMLKTCPVSCEQDEIKTKGDVCEDLHKRCFVWAELGECKDVPEMQEVCPKSCGLCNQEDTTEDCSDNHKNCEFWAKNGECDANPNYMLDNCPKSCHSCGKVRKTMSQEEKVVVDSANYGVEQKAEGSQFEEVIQNLKGTEQYMDSHEVDILPEDVRESCQNRHELCTFWAVVGECESNRAYMATNCAPACRSCQLIDIEARCPPLDNPTPGLKPGELNKMFERIVATAPGNMTLSEKERFELEKDDMPHYTVTVHSRPGNAPGAKQTTFLDKTLPPWVITFDNFATPEECEAIIELGYKYGYKRSEDVGARKFDGTHDSVQSSRRTSENAWCSTQQGCRAEEIPTRLHERIAKITGIPAENSEDLQILRYEDGQFYRAHHDYIPHQAERHCGPRILTFFIYLSDVEQGGGTNFPLLDLTIQPKQGRAVLWPSVLNFDPTAIDSRTKHEAMEVEKGIKFAANAWIHQYDYQTAQANGCT